MTIYKSIRIHNERKNGRSRLISQAYDHCFKSWMAWYVDLETS